MWNFAFESTIESWISLPWPTRRPKPIFLPDISLFLSYPRVTSFEPTQYFRPLSSLFSASSLAYLYHKTFITFLAFTLLRPIQFRNPTSRGCPQTQPRCSSFFLLFLFLHPSFIATLIFSMLQAKMMQINAQLSLDAGQVFCVIIRQWRLSKKQREK